MQIIAHRGFSQEYLENTLRSFEEAIQVGADAIEMDVRLSKDGIPVIFHDDNFYRLAKKSVSVENLTLSQIEDIELSLGGKEKGRVPTLDEVLVLVDQRCQLILEIKEQNNIPELCASIYSAIVNKLSWIEVSCFDDEVLETMHQIDDKIRLHKLIEHQKTLKAEDFDRRYSYIACFDIDVALKDHPKVAALMSEKSVNFWTVADEDLSAYIDLGLAGAMSNDPKALREKYL